MLFVPLALSFEALLQLSYEMLFVPLEALLQLSYEMLFVPLVAAIIFD